MFIQISSQKFAKFATAYRGRIDAVINFHQLSPIVLKIVM